MIRGLCLSCLALMLAMGVLSACGDETEDETVDAGGNGNGDAGGDAEAGDAGDADADADADGDADADADADADGDCDTSWTGVGEACDADAGTGCDGMDPSLVTCLTELEIMGYPISFPGGYCSASGCMDDCDCGDKGLCFEMPTFETYCLRTCDPGVPGDCREAEGYSCMDLSMMGLPYAVCIPPFDFPDGGF